MTLLQRINQLEQHLREASPQNLDLENELLRAELEEHKNFLLGFLEQVSSIEPSEDSMGELSKQNRDFAMMHALRMVSESQLGQHWKPAKFEKLALAGFTDLSILYHYHEHEGVESLNIRGDFVVPRADAKTIRDIYVKPWADLKSFQTVFGPKGVVSVTELPEFAVKNPNGEILNAYHCREPVGSKYRDVVFNCAQGETVLSKSTLQLSPGRGPELSQCLANQEVAQTSKKKKVAMDPIDWGICGNARVFYGVRTSTGHGRVEDADTCERVVSTAIEAVFCWDEEIESTNPEISGPCTRTIHMVTLPDGFKFGAVGGLEDFVDRNGNIGPNLLSAVYNYIGIAVSSAKS